MSAAQAMPVDIAILDRLENGLYEVQIAVNAISEVFKGELNTEHIPFLANTLIAALDDRVASCFEAMSAGHLMNSERHRAEVAHAPRA